MDVGERRKPWKQPREVAGAARGETALERHERVVELAQARIHMRQRAGSRIIYPARDLPGLLLPRASETMEICGM